ncbi:MAG: 3-isopropylmalate dehydratase small subunit [Spirochaetes bacterium GWF1_49_6]|nr:MAG: 3-isopropylmalate dehydratase small subunit [Spirochaetes bacterium GWF1_49_6]
MNYRGKTWKYGDNIDTDKIIPARYLNTSDPAELAKHCLEDEDVTFAGKVGAGDILVAGENFGSGSSREHAPIAIKECGVSVVIAKSFARIFFRNAINIALPVIEDAEIVNDVQTGDEIEIDFDRGNAKNITKGKEYKIHPLPDMMKKIMEKGGLMEYAKDFIKL